jgi:hypothetical protein
MSAATPSTSTLPLFSAANNLHRLAQINQRQCISALREHFGSPTTNPLCCACDDGNSHLQSAPVKDFLSYRQARDWNNSWGVVSVMKKNL